MARSQAYDLQLKLLTIGNSGAHFAAMQRLWRRRWRRRRRRRARAPAALPAARWELG